MMRIWLTLVLMTITFVNLAAQTNWDAQKYELIQMTINFLAKDQQVSSDTNFSVECPAPDYSCMEKELANRKPIEGIDRWYASWKRKAVTDEGQLIALRDQIFADVFERSGKAYRKTLSAYTGYLEDINALFQTTSLREDPIVHADTPEQSAIKTQTAVRESHPENQNQMIAYLTLAIALIALIVAALAYFKKNELQLPSDVQYLPAKLENLERSFERMKNDISNTRKDEIGSLSELYYKVDSRVTELEKQHISPQREWDSGFETIAATEQPAEDKPVSTVYYAKFFDANNELSPEKLKSRQNGEQVFEITLVGEEANYVVSVDPKAQKYGIFNYEYLKAGCDFLNQPGDGSQIITEQPGKLVKSGSNWSIHTKAQIRFT